MMRSTVTKQVADEAMRFTDHAADAANHAIRSTQGAANAAFGRWSERADSVLRRSADALHDTSSAAALRVRDDPLKSVLIAAAVGAALTALVSLVSRARRRAPR